MPSRRLKEGDDLTDDSPPSVNPYEVLGLDPQVTADQVKSAYRKQALKHHPGTQCFEILSLSLILSTD
jgi:DnaJ-class molecular chaperone